MKKIILFLVFSFILLFSFDIKYKYYVKPEMSGEELLKIFKTLPDGTAVIFPEKIEYFFNNKSIIFNKKIVLWLNYSTLNDLNITFKNNFLIIGGIFKNNALNINNVKNFEIEVCYLNHNNILNIKHSSGKIYWINLLPNKKDKYLNNIYQNISINSPNNEAIINNSVINIGYSNFFSTFNMKNSYIKIDNVYFRDINRGNFIFILNSHLLIEKGNFHNSIPGDKDSYATFLTLENSEAIIENSYFDNNWRGILSLNSNTYFKNNKFNHLNVGLIFAKKSNTYILNNKFDNAIGDYSYAIILYENSKAFIKENVFKNVFTGIVLNETTKANIYNNTFENLYKQEYKRKSYIPFSNKIVTDYLSGMGILLKNYTFANILNNNLASNNAILLVSGNNAQYYFLNNIGFASDTGKISKNSISIEIKQVSDFRDVFDKLEYNLNSEFKDIVKKIKSAKILEDKIYEGYLKEPENEDLIVTIGEDEEVIDNGTYLKIKKEGTIYKIIYPEEYKGIELDELPPLEEKIKFKFISHYEDLYNGRVRVWFEINTNDDVKKIEFNHKKLTLMKILDGYRTRPRRMRKFNKAQVVIYLNEIQISYECKVKNNELICKKMQKEDL